MIRTLALLALVVALVTSVLAAVLLPANAFVVVLVVPLAFVGLVYGSVLGSLVLAYVGGVVLVQAVLRPFTSGSEIAVAASTLLTVALFQPVRSRLQRLIDRRFYRLRYDAARTLDDFSVRLRDHVALDGLRSDLLDAARDTVQPTHVRVWLREAGR